MGTPLTWIRNKCSRLFYRFGIHCATHQIRLILISGLVITSLFYPALGIYSSSTSKFFPTSTHILAHIDLLSLSFFHDDIESIWAGHDALRTVQDTVFRAKCGIEKTLRVERILLTTNGFESESGAITHELLSSGLQLETRLDTYAKAHGLDCLTTSASNCVVSSPLEYWSHDEQQLRRDDSLLRTINAANMTGSSFPLRKSMVFAGRESLDTHGGSIDFAAYLVMTYFFHEDDCDKSNGHSKWLSALDNIIASHGVVSAKAEEPMFLTLTFNPDMKTETHISLITLTLYLSYLIFFVYFSGSMRRMNTVHSRIGLCFTGLVEILVSTITSLSVCALYGLRLTLIPWGIFPIVIVFVGAENMFRLIDDVVKTPVGLPVKERIGLGLGRAGTSNTLKVVSYNTILGVIAFMAHGAIRQFCAFAIVVLVAHWFLIHTFFVAVLSIDIQRLELDDLIRQNASMAPTKQPRSSQVEGKNTETKKSVISRFQGVIKSITKGRLTKNISLLLMLVIAATLYYSTLPSPSLLVRDPSPSRPSRSRLVSEQFKPASHVEARKIWHILSPDNDPQIHMLVEPPTIITLDRHLGGMKHTERAGQSRWSSRSLRQIWWIFKIMVLPIGATLSCLYLLLLYLLKGTDRLEGKKDRSEDGKTEIEKLGGKPKLSIYPSVMETDIAFLATSLNQSTVVSVSVDGELVIWSNFSKEASEIDYGTTLSQYLNQSESNIAHHTISTVAVSDRGSHFALGTTSGVILLCFVRDGQVEAVGCLHSESISSAVVDIHIGSCDQSLADVTANYEGGVVLQWHGSSPTLLQASFQENVIKSKLIHLKNVPALLICFYFENGDLEIIDGSRTFLPSGSAYIPRSDSEDYFTEVDVTSILLHGELCLLLAAAQNSGSVAIWSLKENARIATIDGDGVINKLRIFPIDSKACSQCGENPLCSFGIAYSVGTHVFMDRGALSQRCSCPINQSMVFAVLPSKDNSNGRHSRSSSFLSLAPDNSPRPRSRKTSIANEVPTLTASFPISGHGVHSRKASEKDNRRINTSLDGNHIPSPQEDLLPSGNFDDNGPLNIPSSTALKPDNSSESHWNNLKVIRIGEASCERGNWDIMEGKIAGICRKQRDRSKVQCPLDVSLKSQKKATLSLSTLSRWELWIIDPSKTCNTLRSSPLSEIDQFTIDTAWVNTQVTRIPFTRVSPVIMEDSFTMIGFGNTIGVIDMRTTFPS